MRFPKLVIASDGYSTGVLLDGVFLGQGIKRIEFSAEGGESTVRVLDIDIKNLSKLGGEEEFSEFLESTSTLSEFDGKNDTAAPAATGTAE